MKGVIRCVTVLSFTTNFMLKITLAGRVQKWLKLTSIDLWMDSYITWNTLPNEIKYSLTWTSRNQISFNSLEMASSDVAYRKTSKLEKCLTSTKIQLIRVCLWSWKLKHESRNLKEFRSNQKGKVYIQKYNDKWLYITQYTKIRV